MPEGSAPSLSLDSPRVEPPESSSDSPASVGMGDGPAPAPNDRCQLMPPEEGGAPREPPPAAPDLESGGISENGDCPSRPCAAVDGDDPKV